MLRGKSALRRARRRVTPGTGTPMGGTCWTGPQKDTARKSKGEMVVQETTGVVVIRRPGNPRREQGQAGIMPLLRQEAARFLTNPG